MSLIINPKEPYNAEIEDESDSFHSFTQSEIDPSDLSCLSDIDDGFETEEAEISIKTPSYQIESQISEPPDVSPSTANASAVSPIQCQPRRVTCLYMVPKLAGNSKMANVDMFDMSASPSAAAKPEQKNLLDTSPKTEALQKYAFTEIWIEEQQNDPARKRSLKREFTSALDNYFHDRETDQLAKLSLDKQQTGNINEGPIKPANEPYVSPFEDMPPVPEEKLLPGQKPFIVVPAGFDLTNLVEYKDPNHWHRRATTRNVSRP